MIVVVAYKHPDGLDHDADIIEGVDREQAEKRLVIRSPDTVIQKFTVVVEVPSAPIAPIAMVAVYMHVSIANHTKT